MDREASEFFNVHGWSICENDRLTCERGNKYIIRFDKKLQDFFAHEYTGNVIHAQGTHLALLDTETMTPILEERS